MKYAASANRTEIAQRLTAGGTQSLISCGLANNLKISRQDRNRKPKRRGALPAAFIAMAQIWENLIAANDNLARTALAIAPHNLWPTHTWPEPPQLPCEEQTSRHWAQAGRAQYRC